MSEREIGIEEARKILGPLADDAALNGTVTYLTRRGRRYAAIVPLNRIKESNMPRYAYRIDITDDGETWMPYRDDARNFVETDANPEKEANLILTNHLADRRANGEDIDGTRVLLWRDTEGTDDEAIATAVYEETPTTYTAAIALLDSVVAGDFCDVGVVENVIVGYREDDEGNEVPEYAAGSEVVMEPIETTVRTDDPERWEHVEDEAVEILAANGWRVVSDWEQADTAAYARVERA